MDFAVSSLLCASDNSAASDECWAADDMEVCTSGAAPDNTDTARQAPELIAAAVVVALLLTAPTLGSSVETLLDKAPAGLLAAVKWLWNAAAAADIPQGGPASS